MRQEILYDCGLNEKHAWAFGLGLERIAMILFSIPDIRYFWSQDELFLSQFKSYSISGQKFVPYSKLKPVTKDIAFSINSNINDNFWTDENDFYELCREHGLCMIKEVILFDKFYNKKLDKHSRAYHITYSCTSSKMKNPSEFNILVNSIHKNLSESVCDKLNLSLR